MTIEQIIDIPASRKISLEVPKAVPQGKTILSFTPVTASSSAKFSPRTTEEAVQMAEAKAADPNRKPISRHFGKHKGIFGGNGVEYQRAIRDEWD